VAGFRDFQTGEVLTAANVNDFLMQQSVMKFADATARDTALGTAVGGSNALREGMVAYLDDADEVEVYDGSGWVGLGGGGFTAGTAITATDATWSVPSLASPIVRVTVVGGGGGGGAGWQGSIPPGGSNGNASSFACSAGTATAAGGLGANSANTAASARNAPDGLVSANNGDGGSWQSGGAYLDGLSGTGGAITVAYLDLSGVTTANVTVGAGGAGGGNGGDGGDGVVIVEYRAG